MSAHTVHNKTTPKTKRMTAKLTVKLHIKILTIEYRINVLHKIR